MEGFRYVWGRADLRAIMIMLFLIGTFGLNFPIFTSTMAVKVFHYGRERIRSAFLHHGGWYDFGSFARRWPGQTPIRFLTHRRGCFR